MREEIDYPVRFEMRIPSNLLDQIDLAGGKHNRSAWVREAIEQRIEKELTDFRRPHKKTLKKDLTPCTDKS
jgi:metal-responsive CopG/Arc/MetJ family transcriptional regulator